MSKNKDENGRRGFASENKPYGRSGRKKRDSLSSGNEAGRSQHKKLQTIVDKLNKMSAEWSDWYSSLETDFYLLAEAVYP